MILFWRFVAPGWWYWKFFLFLLWAHHDCSFLSYALLIFVSLLLVLIVVSCGSCCPDCFCCCCIIWASIVVSWCAVTTIGRKSLLLLGRYYRCYIVSLLIPRTTLILVSICCWFCWSFNSWDIDFSMVFVCNISADNTSGMDNKDDCCCCPLLFL